MHIRSSSGIHIAVGLFSGSSLQGYALGDFCKLLPTAGLFCVVCQRTPGAVSGRDPQLMGPGLRGAATAPPEPGLLCLALPGCTGWDLAARLLREESEACILRDLPDVRWWTAVVAGVILGAAILPSVCVLARRCLRPRPRDHGTSGAGGSSCADSDTIAFGRSEGAGL